MLTPTAVGSAVDSTTEVVVAPAAMVPTSPKLGTNAEADPAPKVPANVGLRVKADPLVTMLVRFRMALLTSWYTKGLRETSERRSEHTLAAAAWALGSGGICRHTSVSMTFLKVFATGVPQVMRVRTHCAQAVRLVSMICICAE